MERSKCCEDVCQSCSREKGRLFERSNAVGRKGDQYMAGADVGGGPGRLCQLGGLGTWLTWTRLEDVEEQREPAPSSPIQVQVTSAVSLTLDDVQDSCSRGPVRMRRTCVLRCRSNRSICAAKSQRSCYESGSIRVPLIRRQGHPCSWVVLWRESGTWTSVLVSRGGTKVVRVSREKSRAFAH
jgi:hypothetical protein